MTREELKRLLAAAVRKGALTQADAARILSAFDNNTLDPDLPREIKAALDDEGLAGKAALLAAVILLARAKAPAGKVWTYSPSTRRYTAPGRVAGTTIKAGVVSPEQVRSVVDIVIDSGEVEMLTVAEQLQRHSISLAKWYQELEEMIVTRHVAAAASARGGVKFLTQADREFIQQRVIREFTFLDGFADDLLSGKQPLDGRYLQRVRQYAQKARGTFEAMRSKIAGEIGFDEQINILAPADHCPGCLEETRNGWIPLGSGVPITERDCLANDRCHLRFRKRFRAVA